MPALIPLNSLTRSLTPEVSDFTGKPDATGKAPASAKLASDHFAGVDALRGFVAIGVVLLHACVPYARPSMAGLSWSVTTEATSGPVTALFWAIEIVIMPIFLVIAGFFAARSFATRGAWSTTRSRLHRLGKPVLWAVVFLLPIEFYIWMLGWLAEGQVTVREVRRMKFEGGVDQYLWGLCHLWFLPYLMSYVALVALAWNRISNLSPERVGRFALTGCFLVAVLSLALRPEVVWGFQHAFLPVASKWIYSGAFFAAGVFWFRMDPDLRRLAEQGTRILAPASLLMIASVATGIWWLDAMGDPTQWMAGGWANTASSNTASLNADQTADGSTVGGWIVRLSLAILTVASAAAFTFGLIGVFLSRIRRIGPVVRSLAGASFLIYLLHHPVVGLAHISARFALPNVAPEIKVVLVTALGVSVGWSVSWLAACHRERVAGRRNDSGEVHTLEFPTIGNTAPRRSRAA